MKTVSIPEVELNVQGIDLGKLLKMLRGWLNAGNEVTGLVRHTGNEFTVIVDTPEPRRVERDGGTVQLDPPVLVQGDSAEEAAFRVACNLIWAQLVVADDPAVGRASAQQFAAWARSWHIHERVEANLASTNKLSQGDIDALKALSVSLHDWLSSKPVFEWLPELLGEVLISIPYDQWGDEQKAAQADLQIFADAQPQLSSESRGRLQALIASTDSKMAAAESSAKVAAEVGNALRAQIATVETTFKASLESALVKLESSGAAAVPGALATLKALPNTSNVVPQVSAGQVSAGQLVWIGSTAATATAVVQNRDGERFLVLPSYINASAQARAYSSDPRVDPSLVPIGTMSETIIAPGAKWGIVLIKLGVGVQSSNQLPGSQLRLTSLAAPPATPFTAAIFSAVQGNSVQPVRVVGQSSHDRVNLLVTDSRVTRSGDGGAPVFDAKGTLLAMGFMSNNDASELLPLKALLDIQGLSLAQ